MKSAVSIVKEAVKKQYNKVREFTNPFNIILPWLNALFQKYMGAYFNEQIQKEQFTKMGLRNLTVKVGTLNQQLSPSLPLILTSGSVGLLRLDLKSLSLIVEDVVLELRMKSFQEYEQLSQGYSKAQLNAELLRRLKEEAMRQLDMRSGSEGGQGWELVRRFLQKVTVSLKNVSVKIELMTVAIDFVSMRVRKLQQEKDQMVSTLIIGGLTVNIGKQTIIRLHNQCKDGKYDQHIVLHLRIDVKERPKYSSSLALKNIWMEMDQEGFKIAANIILRIADNFKYLQSHNKVIVKTVKPTPETTSQLTWSTSNIIHDYCQQYDSSLSKIQTQDEVESEDDEPVDDDEDLNLLNFIDMSEYDGDPQVQQELLTESFSISMQESLNISVLSESVFKDLLKDEDDQQGLKELENELMIFHLRLDTVQVKIDQFELNIKDIEWRMEKIVTEQVIKMTMITIDYIELLEHQYFQDMLFQSTHEEIFYSCDEARDRYYSGYDQFRGYYNNVHIIQPILQIYSGSKSPKLRLAYENNGIVYISPAFNEQFKRIDCGIKIKIDHQLNQQAISIASIDIQATFDQLRNLLELQITYPKLSPQLPSENLNLLTIHQVQFSLIIQQPYLELLYAKQQTNLNYIKLQYLTCSISEIQLQNQRQNYLTFQSLFLREYLLKEGVLQSELIGSSSSAKRSDRELKPLIQFMKGGDGKTLIDTIPNISIALARVEYTFEPQHIALFKKLADNLKTLQPQGKEEKSFGIRVLIDDFKTTISERIIIQCSKLSVLMSTNSKIHQQLQMSIHNLVVVDQQRNTFLPWFGTPDCPIPDQERLNFKGSIYPANQVILYKQERFNREEFNTVLNSCFQFQDEMAFLQTGQLLYNVSYMNTDDLSVINSKQNIIKLTSNMQFTEVKVKVQHGIINIDNQTPNTVEFFKSFAEQFKKEKGQEVKRRLEINIHNYWVSYFPRYTKSVILKMYLQKVAPVKNITAIMPEDLFYSWVRVILRVKQSQIQITNNEPQIHVKNAQVLMKSTAITRISILNPILLIHPRQTIYYRNERIKGAFQVDNDDYPILNQLCFKKILSLKGLTANKSEISISLIQCHLKKDSILSLIDLAMISAPMIEQLQPQKQVCETVERTETVFMDIFADDDFDEVEAQFNPELNLHIQTLKVSISFGQHFPAEAFQQTEIRDCVIESGDCYHSEHAMNDYFDVTCQDGGEQPIFQLNATLMINIGQGVNTSINELMIQDLIPNSKFSKVIGKDQHELPFMQLALSEGKCHLNLNPIRICLSGASIETLQQFVLGPAVMIQHEFNLNQQDLVSECLKIGYMVYFQQGSRLITIESLIINAIQIVISYDGSGISMDGILKGLMRIASYDNLTLYLKKASLKNTTITQNELQKLLVDQYINTIKSDKAFMQQLLTQLKGCNIGSIFSGMKTMLSSMRQGFSYGIYTGSIPLAKAIAEELCVLAKQPINVCEGLSSSVGLKCVAKRVFRPMSNFIGSVQNKFQTETIPKEFLK